jgi:hypothetical protein
MDLLPLTGQDPAQINSYQSKLTRNQAAACFGGATPLGLGRFIRRAWTGPLRSLADVYVSFRLYNVEAKRGKHSDRHLIAVDCVDGTLDPCRFDRTPNDSEITRIETRNALVPKLEETITREMASQHIRREVYRTGFLSVTPIQVRAELPVLEFYLPFWIGFFGHGEVARLRVLDALNHRFHGAKARAFFEAWILS